MAALGKKMRYLILAAGIFVLCLLISIKSEPPLTPAGPPLVRTNMIDLVRGTPYFTYPGDVRGRPESQLAFQVSGKVIKRNVDVGSVVSPGESLMQIDPKDINLSVSSNEAQLQAAKSGKEKQF